MANAPQKSPNPIRPRSVTLTIAGLAVLGLVNLYRTISLIRESELQMALGVAVDPRVRSILAILWMVIFFAATTTLWTRLSFTRFAIPGLLIIYGIYRIALILLFSQSDYARDSVLFVALLYASTVLFTIWALNRKAGLAYLGF